MKDKFRANIAIVLPAAIIALVLYFVVGLELPAVRPRAKAPSSSPSLPPCPRGGRRWDETCWVSSPSASSPAVLSGWVQVRYPPGTG